MKYLLAALLVIAPIAQAQQMLAPDIVAKFKLDACTKAGLNGMGETKTVLATAERFKKEGQKRTPDELGCLIVGSMNRSQVIKYLGKPSQSIQGQLFYNNGARDPDTDENLTFIVLFGNGEQSSATHYHYSSIPMRSTP